MPLSDEADSAIQSAMFDMNALAAKHDARVLAAAAMSKAAYLYQQLRMLGHETPGNLVQIFNYALDQALEDGEPARVITDAGPATTDGKAN